MNLIDGAPDVHPICVWRDRQTRLYSWLSVQLFPISLQSTDSADYTD